MSTHNSIIIKFIISCQLLYPVVDLKYVVFSLLHWSLLTEVSLSFRESDALHFQVSLVQVWKERGRFVSAPYSFYRRRRFTTDESNQEIQLRSQLNSFAAFWVRLFTLLWGTRTGSDMPCIARGQEEPVFIFHWNATNPIRGTKKWFLAS